jgi:hypothetical protein
VIVAVAGGLLGAVVGRWRVSAGGRWERFEPLERRLELCDPGPRVLQVEPAASSGEREPPGDVQQPLNTAASPPQIAPLLLEPRELLR